MVADSASRQLRDVYVEKCKDFLCEPVKPLIGAINAALSNDVELSFIKLNGNSKELFNKRLEYMQVFALAESLHDNGTVQEIDLSYNNIDDAGVATIARLLKVNKALKAVNLAGNNIGPEGAKKLADSLEDPSGGGAGLLALNLNGNPIGDTGGMAIATMLKTNKKLNNLDVGDCDLGMKSVVSIAAALKGEPDVEPNLTLQVLNMENPRINSVQEEGVGHVARMLAVNTGLRELKLGKNSVRDLGVESLVAYGLCANSTLEVLDLRCNQMSETAGDSLARALIDNKSIRVLNLSCNKLADRGARAVAYALPYSPTLEVLDLTSNGVNDLGLCAVAEGIRQMDNKLVELRVWGNHFGPSAAHAFLGLMRATEAEGIYIKMDIQLYEVDGDIHVAKVDM